MLTLTLADMGFVALIGASVFFFLSGIMAWDRSRYDR